MKVLSAATLCLLGLLMQRSIGSNAQESESSFEEEYPDPASSPGAQEAESSSEVEYPDPANSPGAQEPDIPSEKVHAGPTISPGSSIGGTIKGDVGGGISGGTHGSVSGGVLGNVVGGTGGNLANGVGGTSIGGLEASGKGSPSTRFGDFEDDVLGVGGGISSGNQGSISGGVLGNVVGSVGGNVVNGVGGISGGSVPTIFDLLKLHTPSRVIAHIGVPERVRTRGPILPEPGGLVIGYAGFPSFGGYASTELYPGIAHTVPADGLIHWGDAGTMELPDRNWYGAGAAGVSDDVLVADLTGRNRVNGWGAADGFVVPTGVWEGAAAAKRAEGGWVGPAAANRAEGGAQAADSYGSLDAAKWPILGNLDGAALAGRSGDTGSYGTPGLYGVPNVHRSSPYGGVLSDNYGTGASAYRSLVATSNVVDPGNSVIATDIIANKGNMIGNAGNWVGNPNGISVMHRGDYPKGVSITFGNLKGGSGRSDGSILASGTLVDAAGNSINTGDIISNKGNMIGNSGDWVGNPNGILVKQGVNPEVAIAYGARSGGNGLWSGPLIGQVRNSADLLGNYGWAGAYGAGNYAGVNPGAYSGGMSRSGGSLVASDAVLDSTGNSIITGDIIDNNGNMIGNAGDWVGNPKGISVKQGASGSKPKGVSIKYAARSGGNGLWSAPWSGSGYIPGSGAYYGGTGRSNGGLNRSFGSATTLLNLAKAGLVRLPSNAGSWLGTAGNIMGTAGRYIGTAGNVINHAGNYLGTAGTMVQGAGNWLNDRYGNRVAYNPLTVNGGGGIGRSSAWAY